MRFMWKHLGNASEWVETPPIIKTCREQFHNLEAHPTAQDKPYEFRCHVCRVKWLGYVPGIHKDSK